MAFLWLLKSVYRHAGSPAYPRLFRQRPSRRACASAGLRDEGDRIRSVYRKRSRIFHRWLPGAALYPLPAVAHRGELQPDDQRLVHRTREEAQNRRRHRAAARVVQRSAVLILSDRSHSCCVSLHKCLTRRMRNSFGYLATHVDALVVPKRWQGVLLLDRAFGEGPPSGPRARLVVVVQHVGGPNPSETTPQAQGRAWKYQWERIAPYGR